MSKKILSVGIILVIFAILTSGFLLVRSNDTVTGLAQQLEQSGTPLENEGGPEKQIHPLSIQALKDGEYPGSDLVIEQTLAPGTNYKRYITSYKSEGLKIYALLTIPNGTKPETGWPVVVFNHGYIPPAQYKTTERYIAYTDAFSRNGYIVLRSDYRGHGNSEGTGSTYGSNGYSIDVLNAVSSIKRHPDADPGRIGMWGHSMGGHITLRNMVASKDVKAGVIWAGVVASYPDMLSNWRRNNSATPTPTPSTVRRSSWRVNLVQQYGAPESNPEFWNSISANAFLSNVGGPIQIHHGTSDKSVPFEFSQKLEQQLKDAGKTAELYLYPGDDHDITSNFGTAMQRSVAFFDKYVKGVTL